jgi:hypothetical protein
VSRFFIEHSRDIISCLCCHGDNRRDWPEFAIQFLFEGALFRRGHVVKMLWFCGAPSMSQGGNLTQSDP